MLRPDYVKLDRYFIAQLEQDAVGAEVLRSLLDIAHVMGSRVVAEGIETQEQHRILRTLGVDYLQGYYLSRPALDPEDHPDHITTIVQEKVTENSAEALLVERPSIPPETRIADVVLLFRQHADWDSLAIVADGKPIGIVRRDELLTLLSKPLYPEIYNRKPVTRVMDAAPIVVDARARLEQVSRLVTANGTTSIKEDFIIAQTRTLRGRRPHDRVAAADHHGAGGSRGAVESAHGVAGQSRDRRAVLPHDRAARAVRRAATSTSITSRPTTTNTAIARATRCCSRWRICSRRASARAPISSATSAATISSSSCAAPTGASASCACSTRSARRSTSSTTTSIAAAAGSAASIVRVTRNDFR